MPVVKEAPTLQDCTYYCFTHYKISVLMALIHEACEKSRLLHDHPKCFIPFNFQRFSVIFDFIWVEKGLSLCRRSSYGAILGSIMLLM